jgi:hypothetical protein
MSFKLRNVVPVVAAAFVAWSTAGAPPALADDEPMPPVGQSPLDAIEEFDDAGYIVAFNWVSGYPEVPLSECTLVAIHNPDGSGPKSNTTVYLDVACPSDNFD